MIKKPGDKKPKMIQIKVDAEFIDKVNSLIPVIDPIRETLSQTVRQCVLDRFDQEERKGNL